ncbi:hypothetical protein AXF42_Ash003420 [Apostasia shenzhenica]|uniref:Uncharacterized protein n=1 Tax=Apostasia shenzhenica TaxID=1088818 RepID=A0A2I0BG44_9ASPA|nr:hypothetical protein AXF42_Ash003420 [Apostasia shenzhenica]
MSNNGEKIYVVENRLCRLRILQYPRFESRTERCGGVAEELVVRRQKLPLHPHRRCAARPLDAPHHFPRRPSGAYATTLPCMRALRSLR